MTPRLRRISADAQRLRELFANHPCIGVRPGPGDPPEEYEVLYRVRGLREQDGQLVESREHLAQIKLPLGYPHDPPRCRMLTPVFHPNIAPHAICIADHWTAAQWLADLVVRIGEMICYQTYNVKSPLNGEAAVWATEHRERLPLDPAPLTPERRPEEIQVEGVQTPGSVTTPLGGPFPEATAPAATVASATSVYALADSDALEPRVPETPSGAAASPGEVARTCTNCAGAGGPDGLRECRGGHLVCVDCAVPCADCGADCCVLCPLGRCSVCGALLCEECVRQCGRCGRTACGKHLGECADCAAALCTVCTATCADCRRPLCAAHLDPNGRCPACRMRVAPVARVSYDDLRSVPDVPPGATRLKRCRHCGQVATRSGARYCTRCGRPLDETP